MAICNLNRIETIIIIANCERSSYVMWEQMRYSYSSRADCSVMVTSDRSDFPVFSMIDS